MEVREPDDMCTAFHLACVNNASKCAEMLIKAGCNTTSKNVDNNTGLYEAVMLNHVHVVVTLMDNKVPKETQNFQGACDLYQLNGSTSGSTSIHKSAWRQV